jgi:hypothetical protein
MPDITTMLSQRESEQLKQYAEEEGVSEEEALRRLALKGLSDRLKIRRKRGEVRTFRLPKSD